MFHIHRLLLLFFTICLLPVGQTASAQELELNQRLRILFLGSDGHHQPERRFAEVQPKLEAEGIDVRYTDSLQDLNADTLSRFDGLMIYANIERIEPEQEQALIDYVESGHGLIPVHCASYCFLNSPKYVQLVGGQFKSHKTGTFRTQIINSDHPITKGFRGFESWDETYVHTKHNTKDRTILSVRVDENGREPWTWVRTQGAGRVFYTAWGHDQRTWNHPGFLNLLERGIRWSVDADLGSVANYPQQKPGLVTAFDKPFRVPVMQEKTSDVKSYEFENVGKQIPNYVKSQKWGVQGDPISLMQKPLSPGESKKHFVLPKGFRAELFASEENFPGGKPIAMAWDERSRLWLCMTMDYPNELQPEGKGRDKIVICEDTDGDNRADKFTTFAKGLSIPTSIAFYQGGAIIQDGTNTVYLKDTDGDDVADVKNIVFSGWNMRDTHGGVSNFQYGHDNWIWGMQGYNDSHPLVEGKQHPGFRNGFFRFRPDGSDLEFIRSTNNNTWGLGISEEGIIFGSTANRNPSIYMPIPNRYYEQVRGWRANLTLGSIAETHMFNPVTENVRQVDHHGGYTAGAGHSLYTARTYPAAYWNRVAFVNGPTGHLTGAFVISRDGSNFTSTNSFNLLASDDEWTAPIQAEVGPDGNVWVLDWYNYIVQHNPTPPGFKTGKGAAYETDLRDKRHGRIYRIVYDETKNENEPIKTLASASPTELVNALETDNLLWRRHAQRLLVERGKQDVEDELIKLVENQEVDSIGLNVGAIHALWTLEGLGLLEIASGKSVEAAYAALKHPAPGVRRNAVQVLPNTMESTQAVVSANLLNDADPQIRLMSLLALADLPASQAASEAILEVLKSDDNLNDRWIMDAATVAAAKQGQSFLVKIVSFDDQTLPIRRLVGIAAEHFARRGDASSLTELVLAISTGKPLLAESITVGLANGWPNENAPKVDDALEDALVSASKNLRPRARAQLIRVATRWGSTRLQKELDALVNDMFEKLSDESIDAKTAEQLSEEILQLGLQSKPTVEEKLLNVISPLTPANVTQVILSSLASSENDDVGQYVLKLLPSLTPSARSEALRLMLARPAWTLTLLKSLDQGRVQLNDLPLDQRQMLGRHPDTTIRRQAQMLFKRGGALPNQDRMKVIQGLASVIEKSGDVEAGKVVFKRECSKCHMHSGEGSRVGPDLTGMAVHPKSQLLSEILDPNRSVESNYRSYLVATLEGRVMSGLLASESRTAIELIDAEGKKHSILREDIDELKATPDSLMPVGFEKQIKPDEFTDLLAFLTKAEKFLPIPIEKAATIATDSGMFFEPSGTAERLIFEEWGPKTFEDVPFQLIDPENSRVANAIMLYGPQGNVPPSMPKQVTLPCNVGAKAIHILGGVAGWGSPLGAKGSSSMIVRLNFEDGKSEDHVLQNGVHIADYIRRVDVPESKFAYDLRGRQLRYLAVHPSQPNKIKSIDLVKGDDATAPVVMAITIEVAGSDGH